MKKRLKKLTLSRETLAELDRQNLWPAVGGVTNPPDCDFSNRNTCATCDNVTCTTNFC